MAFTAARGRGFEIDAEHLQIQLKFIADFLAKNKSRYLEGKGQGGQIDMAGYRAVDVGYRRLEGR